MDHGAQTDLREIRSGAGTAEPRAVSGRTTAGTNAPGSSPAGSKGTATGVLADKTICTDRKSTAFLEN